MSLKDGIILVDKPIGLTSFQVIYKIRKLLGIKKAGHTGTLDPFASGLLIIMFGRATKFISMINCDDKSYRATLKFGEKTDTGDHTGEIVETKPVPDTFPSNDIITNFALNIKEQVPPKFSAIKVNGKRAYDLARSEQDFELQPRPIEIKDFQINSISATELDYTVKVSKGTYIRTLSESIAEYLETCGTTTELRRLSAGEYSIKNAVSLSDLTKDNIAEFIQTPDQIFPNIPKVILTEDQTRFFLNGNRIKNNYTTSGETFVFSETNIFLGFGKIEADVLHPKIVFN
jgi:tRNA pseudouridine55 synthase